MGTRREECRIEQKQRRMLFTVTSEGSSSGGKGILRHSKIDYNTRMISLFVFQLRQMEFPACIVSIKFSLGSFEWSREKSFVKSNFERKIPKFFLSKQLLALRRIFSRRKQKFLRLTTIRQCETDGNISFSSPLISAMENSLFRFDALKVFSAVPPKNLFRCDIKS